MARTMKKKPRPQRGNIWKPEKKGDSISGEIVKMDIVNTRFGETPIVNIETDDGETFGLWCGAVLGTELYDKYDVGDAVEVEYRGKEKLDGGNEMNKFKVYDLSDDADDDPDDDDDEEDDD